MPATSKKASHAKRARSPTSESDVSIAAPMPKAKKQAPIAKKHKATPSDGSGESGTDSSVREISPPAPVTPVKKPKICKKVIGPLDDPVQIISTQTGVMSRFQGRRLSFGTIDSDDGNKTDSVKIETKPAKASSTTGKRSRKPSQKAMAAESMIKALDALEHSDSSDLPERISPKKKAKKENGKKSPKKVAKTEDLVSASESEALADKVTGQTGQKSSNIAQGSKLSHKSKGKQRQVAESEPRRELSAGELELSNYTKPKQSTPDSWPATADEHVDAPAPVSAGPAPLNLEHLPISCTIFSYANKRKQIDPNQASHPDYNVRINFDTVSQDLPQESANSVSLALNFASLATTPFVNLARAPLAITEINGQNQLVMRDTSRLVLSLITGSVQSCELIAHAYKQSGGGEAIKRISIIPFDNQFDRYVDYLGSKYNRSSFLGPVANGATLTFSTLKKGAGKFANGSGSRDFQTPLKTRAKYLVRKNINAISANTSNANAWYNAYIPLHLDHEVNVPIFDARETGFAFDQASFDQLRQLPLYQKPGWPEATDLPAEAIVTVIHTTNAFVSGGTKIDDQHSPLTAANQPLDFIINLNLHGVILHGIPPADDSDN